MGVRPTLPRSIVAWDGRWTQAALAAFILVLGALVYVLDRPAEQLPLLSAVSRAALAPATFGSVGGSLPTFAHAFAFSLLTAAWLGGGKRIDLGACLAWLGIDSAFEIGQHQQAAVQVVQLIPDWFERLPILKQADNYFLSGTFDVRDLVSIAAGVAVAYLVLTYMKVGYTRHEGQSV